MSKSKKQIAASLISTSADIFRCPLCADTMELVQLKSLICPQRHCFDLARTGYINFLARPHHTKYDKQMFVNRRSIFNSGFFTPLIKHITHTVTANNFGRKNFRLLDAGCGAGDFLATVAGAINAEIAEHVLGAGMDIAKTGIDLAARRHSGFIWCVGDLAHCPWDDNQFNVVFNILSPANYSEFKRILTDDGLLIKVIPGSNYLQELRALLFTAKDDHPVYCGGDVENLFTNHFSLQASKRLTYTVSLDPAMVTPLIHMTPLSWQATPQQLKDIDIHTLPKVTVDFTVLAGSKIR